MSGTSSARRPVIAADMQLQLHWTLSGRGWADCTISDHQAETEVTASYISTAPEDLLTAVARLVTGEAEARAQFEAEPTAFRWIFYREGTAGPCQPLRRGGGAASPAANWATGPLVPLYAQHIAAVSQLLAGSAGSPHRCDHRSASRRPGGGVPTSAMPEG